MFTTQEIIGDIVYISFNDKDRYKDIGLSNCDGHFKILGYDNIGIWVEHPYRIIINNDKTKSINQEIDSSFVITWDNIKTIMHYPKREGYDFPSEFDKKIGFTRRVKK